MKIATAIVLGVALAATGTVALAARNSSGTYSLASGNPVVGGTQISSTWANNTLGDLAQGVTDSLDRNGRGSMLAPLRVPNGTVTAPTVSFSTETNTGLYRIGAGNPAMSVLGSKRQEWTGTGTAVTGTLGVSGDSTLSGNATVGGTLGVTGVATFTATPLLSAGATLAGGDIGLSKAGGQSIIKSGSGDLVISGTGGSGIQFSTGGVSRFAIDGTTGVLWSNGVAPIKGLPTPVDPGDAAPKSYVDAQILAAIPTQARVVAAAQVVGTTGATSGPFGVSANVRNSAGSYTITLSATYANNTPVVSRRCATQGFIQITAANTNNFTVETRNSSGTLTDCDWSFMVVAGP